MTGIRQQIYCWGIRRPNCRFRFCKRSPASNIPTLPMVAGPFESPCPRSGLYPEKSNFRKFFLGKLMEYNPYPLNRVRQAEEITRHPAFYFSNPDVLETTAYDISDAVFHRPTNLLPQVSKDAFWASQLEYLTKRYKRNGPPQNLKDEIRKIVEYSHTRNISIIFIIPPQHTDAQRRVRELGVEGDYQQFKSDLISMAGVYDCDIDSDLTRDKSNYVDPFHLTGSAAMRFVEDVGSGNPKWCRTLGAN